MQQLKEPFWLARNLKTWLRSTILLARFNSLMLLKFHKERTDNLNLQNVVNEFVSKETRTKPIWALHWQRFLTLLIKVKSVFARNISLKMFCKKGLTQTWTKSLKDICVVLSFCFTQKACSFTKNELPLHVFFRRFY